jgi:hypothetical protein
MLQIKKANDALFSSHSSLLFAVTTPIMLTSVPDRLTKELKKENL